MPTEEDFFKFVHERQLIWYKRFVIKQQQPWTDDPILRKFKIINMYRELDKCTIYLLDKLRKVTDRRMLLINIIFYRFFNLCNLYEDLEIEPFFRIELGLIEKFTKLKETRPIFNNAYLISSGGKGVKHSNILKNLADLDIDKLVERIDLSKTPEESFNILLEIQMAGPFLACEFWTDLTYFNFFRQGWTDDDFVNIGPGAKWGLEILYGNISKKQLNDKLYRLREVQKDYLPFSWKEISYKDAYSNYPYLSITNIEGALCEFRKYWRLQQGKGRRRYYNPPLQ